MSEIRLYLIATPLGNRGDITLRALEVLKSLDCFFAEDSRELKKLLDLYGIPVRGKEVHSYASHNMKEATRKALEILRGGRSVGFASDRGTPCISDPGALLVKEARAEGIEVIPVPGPSSVTAALSVSGIPSDRFVFLGFPPLQDKARREMWEKVRALSLPIAFFESPKRIRETMMELSRIFPGGTVFLAREITKLHESYLTLPLASLKEAELPERGEYVVVLDPGEIGNTSAEAWEDAVFLRLLSEKEWAKRIAATHHIAASDVYNALQKRKRPVD